jgi:hypothetical protein
MGRWHLLPSLMPLKYGPGQSIGPKLPHSARTDSMTLELAAEKKHPTSGTRGWLRVLSVVVMPLPSCSEKHCRIAYLTTFLTNHSSAAAPEIC